MASCIGVSRWLVNGLGRLTRRLGPAQFPEQVQAVQGDRLGSSIPRSPPAWLSQITTSPSRRPATTSTAYGRAAPGSRAGPGAGPPGCTAGARHDAGVEPAQIVDRDLGRRLRPERIRDRIVRRSQLQRLAPYPRPGAEREGWPPSPSEPRRWATPTGTASGRSVVNQPTVRETIKVGRHDSRP